VVAFDDDDDDDDDDGAVLGRLLDAVATVDALRAVALCVCKARLLKRRAKLNISSIRGLCEEGTRILTLRS
jgi:hypothetical protein